jgi:hypothetical protein
MEPLRDDRLIADLRALRPAPRPRFAAQLDERAAAGFPRRSRLSPKSPPDLLSAMRNKGPARARRLLLPAGGVAVAAIAVAVALVAMNQTEPSNSRLALPNRAGVPKHQSAVQNFDQSGRYGEGAESLGASAQARANAGSAHAGSASAKAGEAEVIPFSRATTSSYNASRNLHRRDVERSAEITLGAEPEDVAGDAAKVFEAVHANDGIVIRSSTREGEVGEAGASFELLIPSARLGDALAAFSAIDEVRSRHDATADITHPTVTIAELLRESRARIDGLLRRLGEAETEGEREAIEAGLRQERRHAARLAVQLDHLHRRADFSRVFLQIETGDPKESTGGGAWDIDDALHDAGQVLAVAAALSVVVLAILGPIVLTALLAWLTHRAWVRRERRRVLG